MNESTLRHVTVVDGDGIRLDQRVIVANGKFASIGPDSGDVLRASQQDLSNRMIVPGLIDLHNHGALQHEYVRSTVEAARQAVEYHLAHGTTTLLASIGSADQETMSAAVRVVQELTRGGNPVVVGTHLEGPYLSMERKGAHPPRSLRDASSVELEQLWSSSGGTVRMLTFAPERHNADIAYAFCSDHGIVPAFGHSAADYALATSWFSRGVHHVTHAGNAMNQIDRREPGPIPAALENSSVSFELVADGIHVHPAVLSLIMKAAEPNQVVLITDASSLAGVADGRYKISGREIVARDGGVYVDGTNTVAGSRITLIDAFRNVVRTVGVSLPRAVQMASANPAAVIGLGHRKGHIRPGFDADYLVLTSTLELQEVHKGIFPGE